MRHHKLVLLLVTLLVTSLSAQRSGSTIPTSEIFHALQLREGMTVCEIGAGSGAQSIEAARVVGPAGRVYTTELGEERLKELRDKIAASELAQITVVDGDPVRTNLPDGACDALFMRNVYHHFADPERMNASITVALKPGARVVVVDFAPPNAEAPTAAERTKDGMHGVTAATVARELQLAGLSHVTSEKGTERWFMVVLEKPGT